MLILKGTFHKVLTEQNDAPLSTFCVKHGEYFEVSNDMVIQLYAF